VLAGVRCPAHPAAAAPDDETGDTPDETSDKTGLPGDSPDNLSAALRDPVSDPMSELPPGAIDGVSVIGLLGRGGFATVYLACRGHESVAVKVAHRPGDPRLAREIAILRTLGSPTTPRYIDQGITPGGHPFVIMEYVGLDSLARRLAERPHAAGEPALVGRVLLAICEAVERMHTAAGVVHRDLKPENIVFRPDGRVALIDFGLACIPGAGSDARDTDTPRLTRPGERLGTHHYMAPEQWAGDGSADARTDVYALGALLFEMLTGRPPYVGDLAAVRRGHTAGRCPRPSELAPVSPAVDDVVLTCLAKRPADRYQRALDVAAAFQLALSAAPRQPRLPGLPKLDAPQIGVSGLLRDRAAVVLLAMHTPAPAPAIAQLVEADDAVLARVDGALHVVAWPWAPSILAGLGCARRLAGLAQSQLDASGPMIVHVADLAVRHARGRVRLWGPALQQPATWCALAGQGARRGLWATAAVAAHLDVEPEPGGLVALDREPPEAELHEIDPQTVILRGRDALLAEVMSEIRTSLGDARPLLWTVEGDEGLGKTRVLHALAHLARSQGHTALYLRARAEHASEPSLRALCRLVLRLPAGPVHPGTLAAAWHTLGCTPSVAGAAAMAAILGAATPGQIAPVRDAPGALRQAAAGALALALVQRARQRPLVILLDDAHWAEPETLDALERATMEGVDVPLAVCASARPALFSLRPRWGDRAAVGRRVVLPPLDAAATHALLGDLLRPVEFVPAPVVERLHALSGGVPVHVAEVARMVRASGAIRRHRGLDGYYIAADELLAESDAPVAARLARRALAGVPAPFVPLAELCALLAGELREADARGIQAALRAQPLSRDGDPAIAALCEIDVAVGLSRLVRYGVLAPDAHGHRIRQPILGQALTAAIPAARKRRLHAAVLAHGRTAGWSGEWLAHHAAQAGESDLAAALSLEQAEQARGRHDYVAAEEHYSSALAHARFDSAVREAAISGRGRVRYRLQRFADALADLRRARALAEARSDAAASTALLLEEATVLDWCHAYAEAGAVAAEAAVRAGALGEPCLTAAADLALGRVCYRREDLAAAIPLLQQAATRAAALGEHETRVIALLLLAPALAYTARYAEAEARFEEVMAVCTAAGDEFHLAVAHINRQVLWMKQYQVDRAVADLEACIELGRRLGNAQIERPATFNLAELLYWRGDIDAALRLALRSRDMQRRFVHEPVFDDALLLARILWRRDPAAARAHMDWLAENGRREDWPPHARLLHAMMEQVLATLASGHGQGDTAFWGTTWRAAWEDLVAQARAHALLDEHHEILATVVELACHCGQTAEARHWMQRARTEAQGAHLWLGRLDDMARVWICDPVDHDGPAPAGKEVDTAGGA
jgi:tetratricopeptide (TPR) repeat protein